MEKMSTLNVKIDAIISIHSWISYRRLILMWSILSANMNCVFKRVVLQIFVYIYEWKSL